MTKTKWDKERAKREHPVGITISTKVTSKWRFVDLETGDIWKWDGGFRRATDIRILKSRGQASHHCVKGDIE